jgi:phage gp46-like protein
MHQLDPCLEQNTGHRRIFWTTQPEACGTYSTCGVECAIPGLVYEVPEGAPDEDPPYRTIKTTDWLHGLILNILNTRARTDMRCPTPAATFGHWSESYRDDGLYIGSTMWNAAEKSYIRTADAVKAIANAVRADMGKLIALGLAESVEVEATYRGSNSVAVMITVTTSTGRSSINLAGSFVTGTWIWH